MTERPSDPKSALFRDVLGSDAQGRPIPLHYIRFEVPSQVTFQDGEFVFTWEPKTHYSEKPKRDLWCEFVSLSKVLRDGDQVRDPRPILKFAKTWGPLFDSGYSSEPISVWVEAIRVANSLLRVSLDLAMQKWSSDADWRILCKWIGLQVEAIERGGRVPAAESFRLRRVLMAAVVNNWFGRAVRPHGVINLSEEGCLTVEQLPGGLGGALAYDFAQIIVRRDNRRRCSACNRLLPRNHQARNGIRRYCGSQKCKRAARADASRDYRDRKKLMGFSGRKNSA